MQRPISVHVERLTECLGKTPYRTWSAARHAKARIKEAPAFRRMSGYRLGTYRCRVCRQWHVGNQPKEPNNRSCTRWEDFDD
jgi:hypothetical protein